MTITGTSFTGATAVDFGTAVATGVKVVSNTSITAVSPAGTGVRGRHRDHPGRHVGHREPADQFTYAAAVRQRSRRLSPTAGSNAGGTPVTITGTGFTGATAVDFGTTAATGVKVVNDTQITAVSPAGTTARPPWT